MATIRTQCNEQCKAATGVISGQVTDLELTDMLMNTMDKHSPFNRFDRYEVLTLKCRYCNGPMTIDLQRDER